ncbi:MAG: hypothetical protein FWE88_03855 [Phycisphaerae bacterium]|nr:hypothetical protein [Phycisphaerae bacterium]
MNKKRANSHQPVANRYGKNFCKSEQIDGVNMIPAFESAKYQDHSRQRNVRFYKNAPQALLAIGYWLLAF